MSPQITIASPAVRGWTRCAVSQDQQDVRYSDASGQAVWKCTILVGRPEGFDVDGIPAEAAYLRNQQALRGFL